MYPGWLINVGRVIIMVKDHLLIHHKNIVMCKILQIDVILLWLALYDFNHDNKKTSSISFVCKISSFLLL